MKITKLNKNTTAGDISKIWFRLVWREGKVKISLPLPSNDPYYNGAA